MEGVNMRYKNNRGFTLPEVLITTTIMLLIITVGVPSFKRYQEKTEAKADISNLRSIIMFARSYAITQSKYITVCGMPSAGHCSKDWTSSLTAFIDTNRNHRLDPEEVVIQRTGNMDTKYKEVRYNRKALSFFPSGRATRAAGSLSYCFKTDPPHSKAYVIGTSGRIRQGKDRNKNGVEETGNNQDIPCKPLTS